MSAITYDEAYEQFDDWLDGLGVEEVLANRSAAYVLRQVDPIAYRCAFLDYLDADGVDSDDLVGSDSR